MACSKMALGKELGATLCGKPARRIPGLVAASVVIAYTLHHTCWAIRIHHPLPIRPLILQPSRLNERCESKHGTIPRATRPVSSSLFGRTRNREEGERDILPDTKQADTRRQERTGVGIMSKGEEAVLVPRTIPIFPNWNITVWELKDSADTVNAYWEEQSQLRPMSDEDGSTATFSSVRKPERQLDPFGLVSWPGSVRAAQELYDHATTVVRDQSVVILGAGVGVEAQAAAMLGAKSVVATDIHPTTLLQLRYGVDHEDRIANKDVVQCQLLDLFANSECHPVPTPCDLLVVADVLYNEQLASQVCRRCADVLERNPDVRILITDSQRFVSTFKDELNTALEGAWERVTSSGTLLRHKQGSQQTWPGFRHSETVMSFTGSGVIIEGDQTYDVRVQTVWVGMLPPLLVKNLTTSPSAVPS